MKAAFAARVNLVTQVMEVVNFSCWSRKSRIGTEAHAKIVSLQCFKMYQSAFKINKVIKENSCVYFLFFCIPLLARISLDHNLHIIFFILASFFFLYNNVLYLLGLIGLYIYIYIYIVI